MKLRAAFRLFEKWLSRGARLATAMARHRGKGELLERWEYGEEQLQRWFRHSSRLLALKARWFGREGE